jgi:hypothetical protein
VTLTVGESKKRVLQKPPPASKTRHQNASCMHASAAVSAGVDHQVGMG